MALLRHRPCLLLSLPCDSVVSGLDGHRIVLHSVLVPLLGFLDEADLVTI